MRVMINEYLPEIRKLYWRHEQEGQWPYYLVEGGPLLELHRIALGTHPWINENGELSYEGFLKDYEEKQVWYEGWEQLVAKHKFLNLNIYIYFITEEEAELGAWDDSRVNEIRYEIRNGILDVFDIQNLEIDGQLCEFSESPEAPDNEEHCAAIYYIDGDNGPGSRTKGIEVLGENDFMKIFYSSQNNYYKDVEKQNAVKESGSYRTEFVEVKPGNNSVDFAICIDVAKQLEQTKGLPPVICLISADKHFDVIAEQLGESFDGVNVVTARTVDEAYTICGLMTIASVADLRRYLFKTVGDAQGNKIYEKLKKIFEKEEGNIWEINVREL